MRPLRVTARLGSAFVAADPWSPMLDAVLAYEALRRELGDEFYNQNPQRDELREPVLPLARIERCGDWWWACSCPEYAELTQYLQYVHGRFDDRHERYIAPMKARRVETAGGRYKNMRLPLVCRIADSIRWHVVGDAAEIERLLASITHLGAKRGAGFGQVLDWRVEPEAEDLSGRRWVPAPDGEGRLTGIRPPYWHPAQQRPCIFEGEQVWR